MTVLPDVIVFNASQMENPAYKDEDSYMYSISPLDSGNLYYLIEMPQEVETGSIVISIRVANECYTYSVSA